MTYFYILYKLVQMFEERIFARFFVFTCWRLRSIFFCGSKKYVEAGLAHFGAQSCPSWTGKVSVAPDIFCLLTDQDGQDHLSVSADRRPHSGARGEFLRSKKRGLPSPRQSAVFLTLSKRRRRYSLQRVTETLSLVGAYDLKSALFEGVE